MLKNRSWLLKRLARAKSRNIYWFKSRLYFKQMVLLERNDWFCYSRKKERFWTCCLISTSVFSLERTATDRAGPCWDLTRQSYSSLNENHHSLSCSHRISSAKRSKRTSLGSIASHVFEIWPSYSILLDFLNLKMLV